MEKEITTIRISKETQQKLFLLKIHPRESYDEVIQKLLYIDRRAMINEIS